MSLHGSVYPAPPQVITYPHISSVHHQPPGQDKSQNNAQPSLAIGSPPAPLPTLFSRANFALALNMAVTSSNIHVPKGQGCRHRASFNNTIRK